MRFTKMHGCGNDYVYLDAFEETLPKDLAGLARRISDRHTGVGGDGMIVLAPPTPAARKKGAQARMRMFNADGSQSEMCGNGIRCLAKLAHDHGRIEGRQQVIETGAGLLTVDLVIKRGSVVGASVLMGRPRLEPAAVPVKHPGPGPRLPLTLRVGGHTCKLLAVGMGNPHAVCFVEDPDHYPVTEVGPLIEHDEAFPRRTNVEFVCRLADEKGLPVLRQRTWERGSGETLACGTGSCATVVAAILTKKIEGREAIVRLSGGDLRIAWPADDQSVRMTGPAVTVFTGTWDA